MANFPDNNIPTSWNPWLDWWVRMWWPVAPSDWSDMQYGFYTHRANLGKGWRQEVSLLIDRDAITAERREFGMAVYVLEDWKLYVLANAANWWVDNDKTNNSNWIEFAWGVWWLKPQEITITSDWQTSFALTNAITLPWNECELYINWQLLKYGTDYSFPNANTLQRDSADYELKTTDWLLLKYK